LQFYAIDVLKLIWEWT